MKRNFLKVAVVCFAFLWPSVSHSRDFRNHDLWIVTADDTDSTKRIVDRLKVKFPDAMIAHISNNIYIKDKNPIYVAVGPSALRALRDQEIGGVVVSLFTPSMVYREIMTAAPAKWRNGVMAVYADPSPENQMHLISLIYKKSVDVEFLSSKKSVYSIPSMRVAANQNGLRLNINPVTDDENINRVLNRIDQAKVLLAVPDSTIFNQKNIKNILITSYRKNVAIIGFSAALVKAGALATTYSEIDDTIAHVDELLVEYVSNNKVHAPQYPKYFRTAINDDVAHSLNVIIDNDTRRYSRLPTASKQ